jgi:hypothetical protein
MQIKARLVIDVHYRISDFPTFLLLRDCAEGDLMIATDT